MAEPAPDKKPVDQRKMRAAILRLILGLVLFVPAAYVLASPTGIEDMMRHYPIFTMYILPPLATVAVLWQFISGIRDWVREKKKK